MKIKSVRKLNWNQRRLRLDTAAFGDSASIAALSAGVGRRGKTASDSKACSYRGRGRESSTRLIKFG